MRLFAGLAVVSVLAALGVGWMWTRPPAPERGTPVATPVAAEETRATLAALRPPKRDRPLIAIISLNEGTEVTDYLVPYGILARADVADVVAVATGPGPVRLYPALAVEPEATTADFDAAHPEGADYVIVPAMRRDDDPAVLAWLRGQAQKGAIVIGVCAGAKVVAEAGLLDGRRATTHWYYRDALGRVEPGLTFVPDRRFVVDRGVATTTGITASAPMMLTLVEAIAGPGKARGVAVELGLDHWDARHDGGAFGVTRPFALTALRNRLGFWRHETLALPVGAGVDEVALPLVADAWSRTWRSRVETVAAGPVTTRGGLILLPDRTDAGPDAALPPVGDGPALTQLDGTLAAIAARHGPGTAAFVASQLEYVPGPTSWATRGP